MHTRLLPAIGLAATALILATSLGAGAHGAVAPTRTGMAASHVTTAAAGQSCYTNMGPDASEGINSQVFDKSYSEFDSTGAADFTVKTTCSFTTVVAPGRYYNGTGPAKSETVTVYNAHKGKPGKVINSQVVKGKDKKGTFTIPVQQVTLAPGKYFVGVQANMALVAGGQWGWEVTTTQHGAVDMWQNPGGGMGVCPAWNDIVSCFKSNGPDFMVALTS